VVIKKIFANNIIGGFSVIQVKINRNKKARAEYRKPDFGMNANRYKNSCAPKMIGKIRIFSVKVIITLYKHNFNLWGRKAVPHQVFVSLKVDST
jgi:hypothetical protein